CPRGPARARSSPPSPPPASCRCRWARTRARCARLRGLGLPVPGRGRARGRTAAWRGRLSPCAIHAGMPALVRLAGVNKSYDVGGHVLHVLKDLDMEIAEGEHVAIMGTSGSGK